MGAADERPPTPTARVVIRAGLRMLLNEELTPRTVPSLPLLDSPSPLVRPPASRGSGPEPSRCRASSTPPVSASAPARLPSSCGPRRGPTSAAAPRSRGRSPSSSRGLVPAGALGLDDRLALPVEGLAGSGGRPRGARPRGSACPRRARRGRLAVNPDRRRVAPVLLPRPRLRRRDQARARCPQASRSSPLTPAGTTTGRRATRRSAGRAPQPLSRVEHAGPRAAQSRPELDARRAEGRARRYRGAPSPPRPRSGRQGAGFLAPRARLRRGGCGAPRRDRVRRRAQDGLALAPAHDHRLVTSPLDGCRVTVAAEVEGIAGVSCVGRSRIACGSRLVSPGRRSCSPPRAGGVPAPQRGCRHRRDPPRRGRWRSPSRFRGRSRCPAQSAPLPRTDPPLDGELPSLRPGAPAVLSVRAGSVTDPRRPDAVAAARSARRRVVARCRRSSAPPPASGMCSPGSYAFGLTGRGPGVVGPGGRRLPASHSPPVRRRAARVRDGRLHAPLARV